MEALMGARMEAGAVTSSPPPRFVPRPAQARVLEFREGRLGISAVPGSGKTQTLSYLAAQLVHELATRRDEIINPFETPEVLIVTFSNSAVENFRQRISQILSTEFELLPNVGYRVRTLHALANDIVRMRPALAGLTDDFQIADERAAQQVLDEALHHQLSNEPAALDFILSGALKEFQAATVRREKWPEQARDIASMVIRRAKDLELTPVELRARLGNLEEPSRVLLRLGLNVYETYQRGLQMRNMVDFDDLLRLALLTLRLAPDFLERLRRRWPYVLEDEAQDSSLLQEKMLRLLTNTHERGTQGAGGSHWVRVGDPNQAINTTFTTADPAHLRQFLHEPGALRRDLPDSGRSARPIIDLANFLVNWTCIAHPVAWLRQHAFLQQAIQPTSLSDPQPNPTESFTYLDERAHTPDDELKAVADSLSRWLPGHPDWTAAVLVPENSRGFQLATELKARNLPYEELLRSSAATRNVAGKLEMVVRYLAEPVERMRLADVYRQVWWARGRGAETDDEALEADRAAAAADVDDTPDVSSAPDDQGDDAMPDTLAESVLVVPPLGAGPLPLSALNQPQAQQVEKTLHRLTSVEDFLYPGPAGDWLAALRPALEQPAIMADLLNFRQAVQRWLQAGVLPIDQLILTLGRELFTEPSELALTHKLALVLTHFAETQASARLLELANELHIIARNERRFLGFDTADTGYQPKKGTVTIATMHAAKGLEWDRVYLMALNNYSFPAAQPHDSYQSEPWYARDALNPQAETIALLEAILDDDAAGYVEGAASAQARLAYAAERLRLFYVGITRARKDLIVTWNIGRFGVQDSARRNQAAAAFTALHEHWRVRLKNKTS
ncbi:MAG: ATP-dependent helicase [Anaerolineae bacterium]